LSSPESDKHLAVQKLTKTYQKRRVVDEVSMEVHRGQIVGLLGPNGAGKSTTFYMIVGIIRPDEGRVLLNGEDILPMPMYRRARKGVTYLPQEPSVFRKLTVEENILAILETMDLTREQRGERLRILLDDLKITHLANIGQTGCRGGNAGRVEITRALVIRPDFILLDEPLRGLTP